MVIETSLVSPVDTKQVRKAVRYRTASVHTRMERYDIASFQFLVHFSVPPNFWTCFGTGRLIFFRTRVNATSLRTTFWNRPKWNGTISYPCEQGLKHQTFVWLRKSDITYFSIIMRINCKDIKKKSDLSLTCK